MWVFIDDSGDCGVKFDKGSTNFVVLSACAFRTRGDVEAAAQAIREFATYTRNDGTVGSLGEIKFSKISKRLKLEFFEAIKPLNFFIRSIIMDKRELWSPRLTGSANQLKHELFKQLLTHTFGTVTDATIIIDGQDTRALGVSDADSLKRAINWESPDTVKTIQFRDSRKTELIQLADMIAGATRAFSERRPDSRLYYRTFVSRTRRTNGGSNWYFQ